MPTFTAKPLKEQAKTEKAVPVKLLLKEGTKSFPQAAEKAKQAVSLNITRRWL